MLSRWLLCPAGSESTGSWQIPLPGPCPHFMVILWKQITSLRLFLYNLRFHLLIDVLNIYFLVLFWGGGGLSSLLACDFCLHFTGLSRLVPSLRWSAGVALAVFFEICVFSVYFANSSLAHIWLIPAHMTSINISIPANRLYPSTLHVHTEGKNKHRAC